MKIPHHRNELKSKRINHFFAFFFLSVPLLVLTKEICSFLLSWEYCSSECFIFNCLIISEKSGFVVCEDLYPSLSTSCGHSIHIWGKGLVGKTMRVNKLIEQSIISFYKKGGINQQSLRIYRNNLKRKVLHRQTKGLKSAKYRWLGGLWKWSVKDWSEISESVPLMSECWDHSVVNWWYHQSKDGDFGYLSLHPSGGHVHQVNQILLRTLLVSAVIGFKVKFNNDNALLLPVHYIFSPYYSY